MDRELPVNWDYTTLEELTQFVIGGDWGEDPVKSSDLDTVNVLCIRGSELKEWRKNKGKTSANRKITKSSLQKRRLLLGDILVEISGGGPDQPVGRTVIIDKDVLEFRPDLPKVCTNFFRLVRLNNSIEKPFINYYLQYFYQTGEIVNYQGGTNNLRNLRFPEFSKIDIPLPPLSEQTRIVAKLDALFAHLDTLKTKLDRIPELLKNFRQQVLTEAVTGKLTEEWRKGKELEDATNLLENIKFFKKNLIQNKLLKDDKFIYDNLSKFNNQYEIPKWKWCRMIDVSSLITDGKHGDCKNDPNSGYYFLSVKDMKNGELTYEDARQIKKEDFEEVHKRTNLEAGDILISSTGATIGKVAIAKNIFETHRSTFQKSVAIIKNIKRYTNSRYIGIYLEANVERIRDVASGSAQPNLLLGDLKKFPLILPPLAEQHEIVRRVEELFRVADTIEARYKSLKEKIDTLPQAILTKAFKGELVPQDPNDEPASVLLKRIRKEQG